MSRPPLLLLHGALGASDQFASLIPLLEGRFQLHSINFPGHGDEPFPEQPLSIAGFAEYVRQWLIQKGLAGIDIFGYSMGGYVALYLARHYPELVGRVFTLATKFAWDPETSARETKMLNPDVIEQKVPRYAEQLKARHGDWRELLGRTAEMMNNLGERNELPVEELAGLEHQVMIGIGDRDQMVTMEESLAAYRSLPNGRFIALPGTPHPLEKVSPGRLAREIEEYFLN